MRPRTSWRRASLRTRRSGALPVRCAHAAALRRRLSKHCHPEIKLHVRPELRLVLENVSPSGGLLPGSVRGDSPCTSAMCSLLLRHLLPAGGPPARARSRHRGWLVLARVRRAQGGRGAEGIGVAGTVRRWRDARAGAVLMRMRSCR